MSIPVHKKYLIVIAGPTAVGKTQVAIQLANYFDTDIISADARQCYREMNIGTAKPSSFEQQQAKHYFIDSHSIKESISAAAYEKLSLEYLEEIFKTKNIAILSGGTGLYIKALLDGLDPMPDIDEDINEKINAEYKKNGLEWLSAYVKSIDPYFYEQSENENPHRLIRALVFKLSTGDSILNYRKGIKKERDFTPILIGLELDRNILYQRINERVDKMIEEGLIEEARELFPFRHLKNLQTVGYQEFYINDKFPHTDQEISQAIESIKQHTRNYAKRQMTFFKRQFDMHWFQPHEIEMIKDFILSSMK